jgi:hypothetical protein
MKGQSRKYRQDRLVVLMVRRKLILIKYWKIFKRGGQPWFPWEE